jgi:hypothetical protein
MAAVCAAVGVAGSALTSGSSELDSDLLDELVDFEPLSFSVMLQSESANPRRINTGICFMGHTHTKET